MYILQNEGSAQLDEDSVVVQVQEVCGAGSVMVTNGEVKTCGKFEDAAWNPWIVTCIRHVQK